MAQRLASPQAAGPLQGAGLVIASRQPAATPREAATGPPRGAGPRRVGPAGRGEPPLQRRAFLGLFAQAGQALIASSFIASGVQAADVPVAKGMVLATTTSLVHSGLLGELLPVFERQGGVRVRVLAVGSGQALDLARRGDADAVLSHDPEAEARAVAQGWLLPGAEVLRNDFVLLGLPADPAGVRGRDAVAAFARLRRSGVAVVSRGDRSGTHEAERRLWAEAGGEPRTGLRRCGCGMGQALAMAAELGAYVLADRASWLAHRDGPRLAALVEGDPRLVNRYRVYAVNPARHPHANAVAAQALQAWLLSAPVQARLADFRIRGQRVFGVASIP